MDDNSQRWPVRRAELDRRLETIRGRLRELDERNRATPGAGTPGGLPARVDAAQRHAAVARAAAEQALAFSAAALRHSAEAHDRAAAEHESAAAAAVRELREHHRQAAVIHRAAAIADRQRARGVRSFLSGADPAEPGSGIALRAT